MCKNCFKPTHLPVARVHIWHAWHTLCGSHGYTNVVKASRSHVHDLEQTKAYVSADLPQKRCSALSKSLQV